jgi:hypothetical protein
MTSRAVETSPQIYARLGGWLYLLVIVTGLFAELFVRSNLIVSGDAAATAKNIMGSESLWRLGFASDLVGVAGYVAVTLILYVLLKPVNRNLSLLAAFFSLIGCAVLGTVTLGHLAPLFLLGGADYLKVFDSHQLQALALLSLKLHGYGYEVAMVFFGAYCFVLGYLIFRSGYFPRFLGVLLMVGSLGYFIDIYAAFLAPSLAVGPIPGILGGVAELSLTLWLIVIGVNVPKWEEKANYLLSAPKSHTM